MPDKTQYLTKEKFEELKHELDHLKTVRRKEVAENLEYAKSLGDLSENAEYQEAREEQAAVEDRIQKIELILQSAEIMSLHHSEKVGIGSVVSIEKEGDSKTKVYKIVGSEEIDISSGKISLQSPLGQAMIGKKKGEAFNFKTPKGMVTYKIVGME